MTTTTPATSTVLPPSRTAVTTRRRPVLILGGIVLAILAGLLSYYVYSQTQTQNTVIQVRRDIPRGQMLTDTDLVAITVGSLSGTSSVPASDLPSLIGQRTLIDLKAGALLPAGATGHKLLPDPGKSLLGIRLEPGRIMTGTVTPGSRLRLVITAPPAGDPTTPTTTPTGSYPAVMVDSTQSIDGAALVITVEVDHDQAEQIAPLAAAGRIVVVKDSDQ